METTTTQILRQDLQQAMNTAGHVMSWLLQGYSQGGNGGNEVAQPRRRKKLQKRNRKMGSTQPRAQAKASGAAEADCAAEIHELSPNDMKLELDSAMILELNAESKPTELGSREVHEMPGVEWELELEGTRPMQ